MPWSEAITEQFSLVNRFTTEESEWYEAFNTLLVDFFPPSEHYQISPQFKHVRGHQDFSVHYIIHKRRIPIFFVEVKPYGALKNISARVLADNQMRERFRNFLLGSLPTPKLIGISSFGTQFCVYTLTTATGTIQPKYIEADPVFVKDTAPEDRWEFDVLNDEGEIKLREVVAEVKIMAADL